MIFKNSFKFVIHLFVFGFLFSNKTHAQIISGGDYHSIFICNDSIPWAWGYNSSGQLGINSSSVVAKNTPIQVHNLTHIIAVASKSRHSMALRNDSTVWMWGDNQYYDLGDNSSSQKNSPVQVKGFNNSGYLTGIVAISTGDYHGIAVKADGSICTWGRNIVGQIGDGTTITRNYPVHITLFGSPIITSVAGGGEFNLALSNQGYVYSCGENFNGQLGINSTTNAHTFTQIPNLSGVIAIAAGTSHSLVLKNDSTVWAFGANGSGQLGNNDTLNHNDQDTAVAVTGLTGIIAIAAGGNHSLALKSDGTVWSWGDNMNGDLGDGTNNEQDAPVRVVGLSGITKIACGATHSLAYKNDGTLWAWGSNSEGQIGDNTRTERDSAVAVLYLCSLTGVQEQTIDQSFASIAPNPFTTSTTITFNEEQKHTTIKVIDILGKEIETYSFSGKQLSIEKGTMNRGIYFLQIIDSSKNILNKKLIVQ